MRSSWGFGIGSKLSWRTILPISQPWLMAARTFTHHSTQSLRKRWRPLNQGTRKAFALCMHCRHLLKLNTMHSLVQKNWCFLISRMSIFFCWRFESGGLGGEIDGKRMRTFEESVKSQKTIESLIKNPDKSNKKSVSQKQSTPAPVMQVGHHVCHHFSNYTNCYKSLSLR